MWARSKSPAGVEKVQAEAASEHAARSRSKAKRINSLIVSKNLARSYHCASASGGGAAAAAAYRRRRRAAAGGGGAGGGAAAAEIKFRSIKFKQTEVIHHMSMRAFLLLAWTLPASSSPCSFSLPAGTFDLAPLGVQRFVEHDTLWEYEFSACDEGPPLFYRDGFPNPACEGVAPSPAFQTTSRECLRLGELKARAPAPLPQGLGISIRLGAGDGGRQAVLEVACFDGPSAVDALVTDRAPLQYVMQTRSRVGCPLECARDAVSGAVCGGAGRGSCELPARGGGVAVCACTAGHWGPACSPLHSSSGGAETAAGALPASVLRAVLFVSCCAWSYLYHKHRAPRYLVLSLLFFAFFCGAMFSDAALDTVSNASIEAHALSPFPAPSVPATSSVPLRAVLDWGVWDNIRATVKPFTMVPPLRLTSNIISVAYVTKVARLSGDFLEAGVAAGGSAASLLLAAAALGETHRVLHLYDTFAGLPPANLTVDSAAALEWTGRIKHGVQEVTGNLKKCGAATERVAFHVGDITLSPIEELPKALALVRLDTDWYASYQWELKHFYPRLAPGGLILMDDYHYWPGPRQAAAEFLALPENENAVLVVDQDPALICKPLANGARAPCGNKVFLSMLAQVETPATRRS
jgi:O-methyltransferase